MLNPDHRELIFAFLDEEVEFLIVGAVALAVHATPRATGDLDVWVNLTPRNAERVFRALQKFGAPTDMFSEADFKVPGLIVQIGLPPSRVDVMTSIDGVEFPKAYAARFDVVIDGRDVPFISKRHLIANKRATGRKRDEADLDQLTRTNSAVGTKKPAR